MSVAIGKSFDIYSAANGQKKSLEPISLSGKDSTFVESESVKRLVNSTVLFTMENQALRSGSGTVISPDGLVLTNYHVLDAINRGSGNFSGKLKDRYIVVKDPKSSERLVPLQLKLISVDQLTDIALLCIETGNSRETAQPQALKVYSGKVDNGTEVFACGYPLEETLLPFTLRTRPYLCPGEVLDGDLYDLLSDEIVSKVKNEMKSSNRWDKACGEVTEQVAVNVICTLLDGIFSCQVYGGQSGGPSVDREGMLIGINKRVLELPEISKMIIRKYRPESTFDTEQAEKLSVPVNNSSILRFLEKSGVDIKSLIDGNEVGVSPFLKQQSYKEVSCL